MHSTDHARVKRAHDVLHRHGCLLAWLHRSAHQCGFQCAGCAVAVTGGEIPAGGGDDLVVGNAPAAYGQSVAQAAACGFAQAKCIGINR